MIKVERCRRCGHEGIAVEINGPKEKVLTEWAAITHAIFETATEHEGEKAAKEIMTEIFEKALTEKFEAAEEKKSAKDELIECVEELLDFLKK